MGWSEAWSLLGGGNGSFQPPHCFPVVWALGAGLQAPSANLVRRSLRSFAPPAGVGLHGSSGAAEVCRVRGGGRGGAEGWHSSHVRADGSSPGFPGEALCCGWCAFHRLSEPRQSPSQTDAPFSVARILKL